MDYHRFQIVALVFILFYSNPECDAAKILLLPMPMRSHISYFTAAGAALVQRKHEVYMVLNGDIPPPKYTVQAGVKVITYTAPQGWSKTVDDVYDTYHSVSIMDPLNVQKALNYITDITEKQCEYTITDTQMIEKISRMKFDFAINDGLYLVHCFLLLTVSLKIPYASLSSDYSGPLLNVPALPSFVPTYLPTIGKMTFMERLYNTMTFLHDHLAVRNEYYLTDKIRSLYKDVLHTDSDVYRYSRNSLLWFLNLNPIIDIPRPMMPHVIPIGGIIMKDPSPLPDYIQKFYTEAQDGVIVVSFGSLGRHMPDIVNERLVTTFQRLKQKVVWKFDNIKGIVVPQNVLTMKWLPQMDLLAHSKTVLFITHCGNNGQTEALYSGVPMIGLPIHGDQPFNSYRMEYHGYGIGLQLRTFSPNQLEKAINDILSNKTIINNVVKASKMLRDAPETPSERVVYWLEHVMKYGGEHLRSYSAQLPWYQYLMMDIMAFVLFILFIFFIIVLKIMKYVCWFICRSSSASL